MCAQGRRQAPPLQSCYQNKKKMTLDCRLATEQPRVISLRSWYLTSLVNLSFYRIDSVLPSKSNTQTPHLRRIRLISKRDMLQCGAASFAGTLSQALHAELSTFRALLLELPRSASCGPFLRLRSLHVMRISITYHRTGTDCIRSSKNSRALRFTCTLVPPLD